MKVKDHVYFFYGSRLISDNFDNLYCVVVYSNCVTNLESCVIHLFEHRIDCFRFFTEKFGHVPVSLGHVFNGEVLFF